MGRLFIPVGMAFVTMGGCGFFPEVGAIRDVDGGTPITNATSSGSSSSGTTSSSSSSSSSSSGDGGNGNDAATEAATGPKTHMISVGPGDRKLFQPSTLTIRAGDEVRWLFTSDGHTVVGQGGAWCSPNNTNCGSPPDQDKGAVYSRTFPTPGTFPFECSQHDDDNMKGVITVVP